MIPQLHCNTMSKNTSNASKQEKATVKAYPLFLEILLSGNQMDFSETRCVPWTYSSYCTTQSKCLLRSGQVKPTVWLTLSRTLVTCQRWTEQTQQHIHPERTHRHSATPPMSALWAIMRKIKRITSITPLTHFSRALSKTVLKPFSRLIWNPLVSQDTAEF